MKMTPWTRKYAPEDTSMVVGQDHAIRAAKQFLEQYPKQRSFMLYGPSGTGKTSIVHALANEQDAELFELNASDSRNKQSIHDLLGNAAQQRSFFSDKKIILVDEIDGLSGSQDRGGIPEVARIAKTTQFPIFFTCSDPFDKKFKALRKCSVLCQVEPHSTKAVAAILKHICTKEDIACSDIVIRSLSTRSGGDARAAINDLQMLAVGKKEITREDLEELSNRNKVRKIDDGLTTIFKSADATTALGAFDEVEEDMDQRFLWIDYNVPFEYKNPGDLARAYGCISKADVYRRRIRRRQHWRFLVYINALLTAGVSSAKNAAAPRPPSYKQTTRLLRIWQINMSQAKKKSIAEKIAAATHGSTREIMQDFGLYKHMVQNDAEFATQFEHELELSSDEISWMKR